ncbi:hypothetical protein [Nostoc parmelioides]|uniref:Uncharacterized protein n=1 Tax=Nostoc parmelioides FACHB-3921 TaxID=2692909 RepID=A0ABR8BJD4_9NOSO|nr:hypothetical protein [Nostoc parmelioides]MBD2253809.1 hypothetical protein [Nostoc parmelioides FACHB-3921]
MQNSKISLDFAFFFISQGVPQFWLNESHLCFDEEAHQSGENIKADY